MPFTELFPLTGQRVVVCGDCLTDVSWFVDAAGVDQTRHITKWKVARSEVGPGGAALVAALASQYGAETWLLSRGSAYIPRISTDFSSLPWSYRAFGDADSYVPEQKIRIYRSGEGLLARYDVPGEPPGALPAGYDWWSPVRQADVVVWTDYGDTTRRYGLRPELLLRECPPRALRVLAPKSRDTIHSFPQPHLMVCNLDEACNILGTDLLVYDSPVVGRSPLQQAEVYATLLRRISGLQQTPWIVVTCGEHGAGVSTLAAPTLASVQLGKPLPAVAVDSTGAGDAFLVGLIADMVSGSNNFRRAASYAAAMVTQYGTLPPTQEEVVEVSGRKIFTDVSDIQALAKGWHQRGKTVSVANGCFDLLHAGHLHILTEAARQADKLVVLVDTDESVRRLKGEGRPVYKLEDRMKHLAALSCVAAVVPFDGDTQLKQCIAAVRASVLVKGSDYSDKEIVGETLVGRVLLVPRIPFCSTTEIVDKLST